MRTYQVFEDALTKFMKKLRLYGNFLKAIKRINEVQLSLVTALTSTI